jgi:hypothetical protein
MWRNNAPWLYCVLVGALILVCICTYIVHMYVYLTVHVCINLTEAHTSHIFIYFVTLRLQPSLFPAMKIWIQICVDPHYFGKPSPDPHRRSRIRICFKVKRHKATLSQRHTLLSREFLNRSISATLVVLEVHKGSDLERIRNTRDD